MGTISISFANELRSFWQEWNIRIFVLLSQFLRIVLSFLLPHRKSSSNSFILLLSKATYVLSYIVAGMALTLISSGMPSSDGYQPPLVLWASFILLHLSGGGHALAYTIDEYETWYKHSLNFISHDMIMFLVILLQWHQVAVPAGWALILVFAYLMSFRKMNYLWLGRSDLRVSHILLKSRKAHNSSVDVNEAVAAPDPEAIEEARRSKELDEVDLVRKAFKYCGSSEKLFLGLSFTRTEREQSRKDFLELNPKDAIRVVEIELNIAYDAYYAGYANPPLLKYNRLYSVIYIVSFIFSGMYMAFYATLGINRSFLSFSSNVEDKYKSRDWIITRILCFSNVFLIFMGMTRRGTSYHVIACWNLKRLAQLLSHMRRWSSGSSSTDGDRDPPRRSLINFLPFAQGCLKSLARIFLRRWSETISTRSFMIECLIYTGRYNSIITMFLRWCVTPSTYGSKSYNDDIGIFIFTQLQEKAISLEADENAGRDVLELQGDLFLRKQQQQTPDKRSMHLPDWYLDLPFDIRQLLWHIATEILYNTRDHQQGNDPDIDQCREMSNLLSEYMMYLTFECRHIMSRLLGNFHVRFHDISKYIRKNKLVVMSDRGKPQGPPQERLQRLYKKITDEYNDGQRIEQPVLLQAVKIADGLMKLDEKKMWEVISDEWVEILVYAATHCDPMAYVEKLAEGGELITIVCLLSAHLGFGNYFLDEEQEKEKKQEDGCFRRLNAYISSRV